MGNLPEKRVVDTHISCECGAEYVSKHQEGIELTICRECRQLVTVNTNSGGKSVSNNIKSKT